MSEENQTEVLPPVAPPPPPPHKRNTGRRLLMLLTMTVILFAVGFFVAYFTLYLPARDKAQLYDAAQSKLATTEQQLGDLQAKYDTAAVDVTRYKNQSDILKLQHAIVTAELALMKQDSLTATQAIELAAADMDALLVDLNDSDTAKALQERMTAVRDAWKDKEVNKTISELQTLDENLAFLYQRVSK